MAAPQDDAPPLLPAGLDVYRQWHLWPCQRIGVRAYLRSTYDRTGHNRTADASHYLYQQAEDFHVTLDVEGHGVLYFVRANRWHGSPWHYELDGLDHLVAETNTADPLTPRPNAEFLPPAAFPPPLAYTWTTTHGADLSWVPMPFEQRLRLGHSRTYYGTGYYIYHLTAEPVKLPPWSLDSQPDSDVLRLLERAGEDPLAGAELRRRHGRVTLGGGTTVDLLLLEDGPGMIRRLCLSAPSERAREFGTARLRVTWDGREQPSIDAPLALLHGAGTLHRTDDREYLVKAFPVAVRFAGDRVHLACYLPMPYFRSARFELYGVDGTIDDIDFSVATEPYAGPWNHVGYLHATYRDHGVPELGRDLEFLDTAGIEGSPLWSGSVVGTAFVFTDRNVMTTLEGDPRFYFDDSLTPQVQGTGTEEWGGGGDYWGGRTMSLPLAGHPTGIADANAARHPEELVHSAYRFLLADLMPFGRRARVGFEHGGENESVEHYASVTYWYGLPAATLVLSDTLDVADPESEAAHQYCSPDATAPYALCSRYEGGPDHLPVAIAGPLAEPHDHADFTFTAPAGRYHVWLEARSGSEPLDGAVWLQFNDAIGSSRLDPGSMGSMGFLNVGRPPGSYRFTTGSHPVSTVQLPAGRQRLRLQPRHGRVRFSRIVLGPQRTRQPQPGETLGDDEIVVTHDHLAVLHGSYRLVDDPQAPTGCAVEPALAPAEMEIFAAHEMSGRRTVTASELTLRIEPDNHGVLLRRTLDYGYANQRARVLVDVEGQWQPAGIWYLAGCNTVYHSFPWAEGELAPARPVVITSNRRFRDDEFLLSPRLTRGQRLLRLRFEYAPRNPPLLPGMDPAPSAWTEFRYSAYSYVMPNVTL